MDTILKKEQISNIVKIRSIDSNKVSAKFRQERMREQIASSCVHISLLKDRNSCAGKYYALIKRARGPYEEIFIMTFKAYGKNAVRSMRLERQNKYFPYGPRSRLIRALLYTHINKLIFQYVSNKWFSGISIFSSCR